MKNINTLSMHGEKFYQLHTDTTIAVATSKYSGKTDHSEIERTKTIRKQQAYFLLSLFMRTKVQQFSHPLAPA